MELQKNDIREVLKCVTIPIRAKPTWNAPSDPRFKLCN